MGRTGVDFGDWLAIANVKAAYCRLLDTKDWDGWGQLFTEDFELDVTGSGGQLVRTTHEAMGLTTAEAAP